MGIGAESTAMSDELPAKAGIGTIGRILVLWYLASIFTVFSLKVGELRITYFFALPAALAMFARNKSGINSKEIMALGLLLSVALLSVVAGMDADFIGERVKSFLLFCYSIFMVYALRLELGRATRRDISWTSGWLLFAILAVAFLEWLGPLKPISDAFRLWNANADFYYTADLRDLKFAGFVRPSAFTPEPSLVAIGVAVLSFTWFVSTRSKNRLLLIGIVTVLVTYLVRSPISSIVLPSIGLVLLAAMSQHTGNSRGKYTYAILVALLLVLPVAYLTIATILAARGGVFTDQSLAIRLLAPPRLAAAVIQESPFIGIGVGGRGAILEQINTTLGEMGLSRAVDESTNEIRIANAFWEHWIYFGLFGGAVAAFAIIRYFRLLCGGNCAAAALFLVLLANTMGAYVTPRLWSYATLVVIATMLFRRDSSADQLGVPDTRKTVMVGKRNNR